MTKKQFKYLPELSILALNVLYNLFQLFNDLGFLKVPGWILGIDVPNICLFLLFVVFVVKAEGEKNV